MLRAGRRTPRFLLVLFVFWVLSPFVVLAWANVAGKRWSVTTRTAIYWLTLAIALASLTIYAVVVLPPPGSPRAPVFVALPPLSWLLPAIGTPLAPLVSRPRR